MNNLDELRNYLKTASKDEIIKNANSISLGVRMISRRRKKISSFPLYINNYKIEDIIDILYEYKRFDVLAEILYKDKNNHFYEHRYELIETLEYIPSAYFNDVDIFNYYAQLNRFDIAVTFNFYLYRNDQYKTELYEAALKKCANFQFLNQFFYNKYMMNAYVELGRYDVFVNDLNHQESFSVGISLLSEENKIKLFNYLDQVKYIRGLALFSNDLLTDEYIRENFKYFYDYISNNSEDWYSWRNIKYSLFLLGECFKKGRIDLAVNFNLTEEIIKENIDKFYEYIKEINDVPFKLKESISLLNKCLEEEAIDLVLKFNITEEIVKSNIDKFYEYIKEINDVPFKLKEMISLLNKCLEESRFDLVFKFDISEEIVKSNIDKFYEYIKEINDVPYNLMKSIPLLNRCISENRLDLAVQFNISGDVIVENLDGFYEYIKEKNNVPYNLMKSIPLLNRCISENRFDLAVQFNIPDDVMIESLDDFYEYIKKKNNVPYNLIQSIPLLNRCISENRFDLAVQFNIPENIINENLGEFYEYIIRCNFMPIALIQSKALLNKCIQNKNYKLASFFSKRLAVDEDLVDQIIIDFDNDEYKYSIIDLLFNDDLVEKIHSKTSSEILNYVRFNKDILYTSDMLKKYARALNIVEEELREKLRYLINKNDEILDTIYPKLLSRNFDIIKLEYIEKIGIYSDIQMELFELNNKSIKLIAKILNILNSSEYDLNSIIYNVLINLSSYSELVNSLDLDKLSEEEIKNLIYVLNRNDNIFGINNYFDLKEFDKKKDLYFAGIQSKIEVGSITIDELKISLLERKYGLSLQMAKFICDRYCADEGIVNDDVKNAGGVNQEINPDLRELLSNIHKIYKSDSLDYLSFLWENSETIKTDFYSFVALESAIRAEYATMYSSSLYKLNESHRVSESHYIYSENRKIYELLLSSEYKDKKPQFYILDGDFNLQIHVLGAYRYWKRPADFKEDWNRPKIAYHGICTSYIGNDQIANARIGHPVYGFDSYESSALLCAGNYDLGSDDSIAKFATAVNKAYNFYTPQVMKDKTRHTHNEMVLERRNNLATGSFKRNPSYVVYFVDDINNSDNFSPNNELYNETLQAAIDNNIPIVIVDRLKYAKSEAKKCEQLKDKFYSQKDFQSLKQLFTKYCNNMVGCKRYDNDNSKYHDVFDENGLDSLFNEIFTYIKNQDNRELLEYLSDIIKNEQFMSKYRTVIDNYLLQDEYAVGIKL